MAIATFTIDLNGGDVETADNALYFKIYGSANGYTTPIATTGTDIADANVSTAAGIATITNVNIGTETMFKVGVVDGDSNESVLSTVYSLITELYTLANAANIANEANAITDITNQSHTSPSSISSDKSPNGGSYSIQVDQTVAGSNKRSVFTLSVISGKTYRITYDAKKLQAGGDAGVGNGFGGQGWNASNFTAATTSWASYSQDWVANITGTATIFLYPSYSVAGAVGDKLLVDRISIIELP